MTESDSGDLAGLPCAVGDCRGSVAVLAHIEVTPLVEPDPLTLSAALCHEHRDVLRYGITSCKIDT